MDKKTLLQRGDEYAGKVIIDLFGNEDATNIDYRLDVRCAWLAGYRAAMRDKRRCG